jgi:hypothetical protein
MAHAVNDPANYMSVDHATEVIFTYDVVWEESDVNWANRWDVYLRGNPDDKVHWFSITNSTMIVVFLTVMVAMILVRTLNHDIAQYNDAASLEEAKEESGWKLVSLQARTSCVLPRCLLMPLPLVLLLGARGCVPPPRLWQDAYGCHGRHRLPAALHDGRHPRLCASRLPEPCQPREPADGAAAAVRDDGVGGGLPQ